ncbi:cyclic nucleotide-binding domain-containing protein [Treponema sp.]|uniref:cyclic nucleotide-binding domain-containing protein n=1 Tax=Treponema sp. TaxID=166 RepID=UPI00298E6B76|nr:cyclic nucleotide-binding domain-containing protein [Treponema sp.]MCR5612935.1 cyclic nucleotide-binding domain-containing protein [Treponema sp.]
MKKILAISSNPEVINTVKAEIQKFSRYFNGEYLWETDKVINYVNYELPELKILDYTSKDTDCDTILSTINADPWLHYGGIIAVCESKGKKQTLEDLKDSNILCTLTLQEFKQNFARLLKIVLANQQFIFHRGLQNDIGNEESVSFTFDNDLLDIHFYSSFLVSYLYNTNRISTQDRFNLQMTLSELLNNALEHGNLEISYQEKTDWMMEHGDIVSLIQQRRRDPKYANRKITVTYSLADAVCSITIADDGDGFDWRKFTQKKVEQAEEDEMQALHGRGIALSSELLGKLSYNEKGNQVTLKFKCLRNSSNNIPGVMRTFETVTFKDREVICRENEQTNDLYFIVSGKYAVYAGRKLVSVLTPNDMFIGDMSFLLNDRRSATVLASGNCRLIKIPKIDFLDMIRKNPHYGIFLSKMLAQRLFNQTHKTLELTKLLNEEQSHVAKL